MCLHHALLDEWYPHGEACCRRMAGPSLLTCRCTALLCVDEDNGASSPLEWDSACPSRALGRAAACNPKLERGIPSCPQASGGHPGSGVGMDSRPAPRLREDKPEDCGNDERARFIVAPRPRLSGPLPHGVHPFSGRTSNKSGGGSGRCPRLGFLILRTDAHVLSLSVLVLTDIPFSARGSYPRSAGSRKYRCGRCRRGRHRRSGPDCGPG